MANPYSVPRCVNFHLSIFYSKTLMALVARQCTRHVPLRSFVFTLKVYNSTFHIEMIKMPHLIPQFFQYYSAYF